MFQDDDCTETELAPLVQAIKELPLKQACSVVGNGMHLTAIGASLIFIMACTQQRMP